MATPLIKSYLEEGQNPTLLFTTPLKGFPFLHDDVNLRMAMKIVTVIFETSNLFGMLNVHHRIYATRI